MEINRKIGLKRGHDEWPSFWEVGGHLKTFKSAYRIYINFISKQLEVHSK